MPKIKSEKYVDSINPVELVWDSKVTEVDHTILPFQTVETINEPKDRQRGLSNFIDPNKKEDWKNILIWGDNKLAISSLLPKFSGKIKLIYIDPPFFTGSNMPIQVPLGENDEIAKSLSAIEEIGYRNIWKRGMGSFFQWMYDRLILMRELLSDDGNLFVRFDYHYSHYVKIILDEVFGKDNFRNEIVINRTKKIFPSKQYNVATDSLFWYSKSKNWVFNPQYKKREKEQTWINMHSPGERNPPERVIGRKLLYPPKGRHWTFIQETVNEMEKSGRIRVNESSEYNDMKGKKVIGMPQYLTSSEELLDSNWTDIPGYSFSTGYPTENSEQLLTRVILSCSKEGDLVADFFGGSGTTAAVAEKFRRRWITCDIGKFSIHTIRKRLLDISQCKPFEILNLGNYQRHKFKEMGKDTVSQYLKFILDMYRAQVITGYEFIHGKKANRWVHIGAVDSIVTEKEIKKCIEEAKSAGSRSLDILGWDFEMGLHDTFVQISRNEGFDIKLVQIPKEALEVKDALKEEVKFFEMPYLDVNSKLEQKKVILEIKDFVIKNTEYIPEEVLQNIKEFTDLIDYWSIDWDYKDDTFHNQWQSFRTQKHKNLEVKASHTYEQKGNHKILVKVIDIFGNDTNKLIEINLK